MFLRTLFVSDWLGLEAQRPPTYPLIFMLFIRLLFVYLPI